MEYILTIIGILVSVSLAYFAFPEFKKYIPFSSKPFLLLCYHKHYASDLDHNTSIFISILNQGDAPANYLTATIESKTPKQWFIVKGAQAAFNITTSGSQGSRVTISAQNILPQQRGSVWIESKNTQIELNHPYIKSDARSKFVGEQEIRIGKTETYEEYKHQES